METREREILNNIFGTFEGKKINEKQYVKARNIMNELLMLGEYDDQQLKVGTFDIGDNTERDFVAWIDFNYAYSASKEVNGGLVAESLIKVLSLADEFGLTTTPDKKHTRFSFMVYNVWEE